eukprot:scaffold2692_cov135-Ochromonas_danica.AAC.3
MEQMLRFIFSYPPPATASSGEEDYLSLSTTCLLFLLHHLYEGYHENDNIFSKRPAILHMD